MDVVSYFRLLVLLCRVVVYLAYLCTCVACVISSAKRSLTDVQARRVQCTWQWCKRLFTQICYSLMSFARARTEIDNHNSKLSLSWPYRRFNCPQLHNKLCKPAQAVLLGIGHKVWAGLGHGVLFSTVMNIATACVCFILVRSLDLCERVTMFI